MDWLVLAFALELGAIRGPDIPVDVSSYVQTEATVTVLRHLEIGGSLRSYQVPVDTGSWAPFQIDYSVKAVVNMGDFEIGVEHFCAHPVNATPIVSRRAGGWEHIFLRYSTPQAK